MDNPEIEKYLAKYVRGSNCMDFEERIKIFKLMWDAIGSEFGGRHELYEINYTGSQDLFVFFKDKKKRPVSYFEAGAFFIDYVFSNM